MKDKTQPQPGTPYPVTVHTWECTKGHHQTVSDEGYPQRPGTKEKILACWAMAPDGRCAVTGCGASVSYAASTAKSVRPAIQ